jgi:cell division transport system permease protein
MAAKKVKNTVSFFNSHLISVISISLVLYLLGLILIFGFLGNELSRYVKENISISVVLTEDLANDKLRSLQDELKQQPYVKSLEFVSKEQALSEMQRELGENPETFLGFNPFRASIEVKLKSEYTHPDSLVLIEKRLSSKASVTDVLYRKDMIQTVNQNIRSIGMVLFILLFVLIAISFVLINNTVRLLIYSKRFLIYTMRLVGATSSFIRQPFIRHNILSGLFSGILAIILLMGSLYYVKVEFMNLEDVLKSETMMLIYVSVLASGVILSVLAAFFAVNRYLRMSHRKMFYI